MKKIRLGFALCGSFCTLSKAIEKMEELSKLNYDIIPIMSFNAYNLDTKFGKAQDFIKKIENISGKKIINTLQDAEPIGPKNLTDIMLVCPCTGNTLNKICNASSDTPVSLAIKSHLRVQKPVVIFLATNDALAASATNFGKALNTKNIYFVPLGQDDPINKKTSLVSHFELVEKTLYLALKNKQIQPIFKEY